MAVPTPATDGKVIEFHVLSIYNYGQKSCNRGSSMCLTMATTPDCLYCLVVKWTNKVHEGSNRFLAVEVM